MYPFLLQNLILPFGSLFFGGNFHRELREWERYDRLSENALLEIQQRRLKEMMSYALKNVPYYQSKGLTEDTPIHEWPILSKELLRKNHREMVSREYAIEKLVTNFSSGSSGLQSFTYMSHEEKFLVRAIQTNWWKWGGYRPGERLLQLGMSPKRSLTKKLKDIFFRVDYMNAFSLNDEVIETALNRFGARKAKHIVGYPSAMNEVAKFIIRQQKQFPFKSLISLGDKLFSEFRNNFESAFDHPIIVNTYGCAEGYMIGCQLDLDSYYIMAPHVYIEIVDDEGNVLPDGARGHILVTGLTNKAMPLFRYKLGDLGALMPKEEYPSERRFSYPLLKELIGRETDVIKTPTGITLIVHSFTGIFEYYESIKQFKIIQETPSEVRVDYITDDDGPLPKAIEVELMNKLDALSKGSLKYQFKRVEFIPPSPSGKPQIIESKIR